MAHTLCGIFIHEKAAGNVASLKRLRLHRLTPLGPEHISSLDFLVAVSTDKPDLDQSLACLIPLTSVLEANLLAPGAPRIGMRICRFIRGNEETLANPMQQVIADVRFLPITVSVTVNSLVLVCSG
jgi:hypothetical protein